MNTFINFVNKSLAKREMRDGMGALKRVGVLLLPALDLLAEPWAPISLSCSPLKLVKGLT